MVNAASAPAVSSPCTVHAQSPYGTGMAVPGRDQKSRRHFKRLLVPIDFSEHSLNALTLARKLAQSLDAELLLLHVVEPAYRAGGGDVYVTGPQGAVLLKEQLRMAGAQLNGLAADLKKEGCRCRTLLKRGVPARIIAAAARQNGAQLIIMGTHGRTGLRRVLLGSVAECMVRTASCPVVVVRQALRAQRVRVRR